ncbi:Protein ABHD11 like protein [Argiope bruennichi]|uniref:sn-1-specific diacylglycerol lipase ABHD11 n=1 Tax=Argiope bruennichi TaxID=94029 RepID=A0A8T0E8M0_ARGBR|nr:Protein ABHD11 like protein [Argiope bruennichi]
MTSLPSLCCRAWTGLSSFLASSPSVKPKSSQKLASNSEPVQLAFHCAQPQDEEEGKAPITLLHGITASKECWFDIPQILAKKTKRKVYAVDLRHHGDSPWSDTFEFDSNILDLQHFMETEKIDKVILVGHSMGGMIAIKFALAMPQKIEKLVVEDVTIGKIPQEVIQLLESKLEIAKASIKEIPGELDDVAAHKLLPKIMIQKVPPDFREFVRFDENTFTLKKVNGKFTFKVNINAIESALKRLSGTIPKPNGCYSGSTCFIYGKKSPFNVGSDENIIKRYFPNAELIGIENAGHTVHNECRSEFLNSLLSFLCKEYTARL